MGRNSRDPQAKIYPHIAEAPLPDKVQLTDIIRTLPREVFEIKPLKAWGQVALTLVATVASWALIHVCPWYLLLPVWILNGTIMTGWFVIGHDAGHRSFSRSNLVNDIVGHIALLPFCYPFHCWRLMHDLHHRNTNKLHVDNAWHPFERNDWDNAGPITRFLIITNRSWPWVFYWIGSVGHWIQLHFWVPLYEKKDQRAVSFSIGLVAVVALIFFPTMIYTVGFAGLVRYWFGPFLVFHFWLSTFTLVHHTLPHVPFLAEGKWTDAGARLSGTVHCEYPIGVERFCHHINVHTPHHVTTMIPSYNLRMAHESLKANWGKYMNEARFGLPLVKDILSKCNLYDEDTNYITFAQYEQEKRDKAAATAVPKTTETDKKVSASLSTTPLRHTTSVTGKKKKPTRLDQ